MQDTMLILKVLRENAISISFNELIIPCDAKCAIEYRHKHKQYLTT